MRILTTVTGPSLWTDNVDAVRRQDHHPAGLIRHLVARAPDYDAVVVNGSSGRFEWYGDLVAAGLIGRRHGGPIVLVIEANWKHGPARATSVARRTAIGVVDAPSVHYTVFSQAARWAVAARWGLDPTRIHPAYCPVNLRPEELAVAPATDGGVFAGGNSLRDYAPLLEAAADIPARVTIATNRLRPEQLAGAAPNVDAGPLPPDVYTERLRGASIVVVPLEIRTDRSAGEQTCLNAMAFGKIVIVTDALGIREYVEDGVTGIVVPPGDPQAISRAVHWAMDPANAHAVDAMRAAARRAVEQQFMPEHYIASFFRILETLHARRAGGRT